MGEPVWGTQVAQRKYQGRRLLSELVEQKCSCRFFLTGMLQATGHTYGSTPLRLHVTKALGVESQSFLSQFSRIMEMFAS